MASKGVGKERRRTSTARGGPGHEDSSKEARPFLSALLERFGRLTPIQERAIPEILAGWDVLLISPTGSGKTEAALIPCLERLSPGRGLSLIYVTPLRALNRDVVQRIKEWTSVGGLRAEVFHGDTPPKSRERIKRKPPEVLVTTPESLQTILGSKRFFPYLSNLRFLILDELHEVLDTKRGVQLGLAIARLRRFSSFQVIGLSATIGNEDEARRFVGENAKVIKVWSPKAYDVKVKRVKGGFPGLAKAIQKLAEGKKVLVFTNTRQAAEHLGALLVPLGAEVHHSSLAREQREEVERRFKTSAEAVVIATSSLELGIDVGDIDLVIQVGSPRQVGRLVQRVGRAGHGIGRVSRGVILCTDEEEVAEARAVLDLLAEGFLEPKPLLKGSYDVVLHQAIGEVLYEDRPVAELYERFSHSPVFALSKEKFLEVLKFGEEIGLINLWDHTLRRRKRARPYYFSNLSTIPDERHYAVINAITDEKIGVIDEKFAVELDPGQGFVMKGRPWKVLDFRGGKILVEPASPDVLTIPSWVGEELPVPPEVARRSAEKMGMPKDRLLIVFQGPLVALWSPLGTLANFTFSKLLTIAVADLLMTRTSCSYDAYRLFLSAPGLRPDLLERALWRVSEAGEDLLREGLRDSSRYFIHAVHVARSFGLVGREERVDRRTVRFLRGTVAEEEVLNYVLFKYFDVDTVVEFLRSAHWEMTEVRTLPPWARRGLEKVYKKERGAPLPASAVADLLREKVLAKKVKFTCGYCGYFWEERVGNLPPLPTCPRCGARRLAVGRYSDPTTLDLVASFGRKAVWGLLVPHLGPQSVARVLRRAPSEEDLFRLFAEEQRRVLRSMRYWKV